MVVQLPDGALAAAVGVQVYSFICLICSCLMILLVYKHRERDSYVALFSYCTFLGTTGSIAQQLHTIVLWNDVKTEQFYHVRNHVGSPELAIAGPSYGLDLILFYIQFYSYNVEAILTLSWAFSLAFSIFKPSGLNLHQRVGRKISIFAKVVAFLLPAVLISLLQVPAVRASTAAFITLADFNLAASLTLGSITLITILVKYIQTRRRLHRWTVRYPLSTDLNDNSGESGQDSDSVHSIYDGWLVVRFTIALLFIEAFQILAILSEIAQVNNNKEEVLPEKPDLSAGHAVVDFVEYIPGVSTGLLVFLVFGTTQACKRTLYVSFVPRKFRSETTLTDTHVSASAPRFDHQARNFITSPYLGSSSRNAPEAAPSRVGGRTSPHMTSPCPVLRPKELRFSRSRTTDLNENQGDNIDACSFNSFDVSKLSQRGDAPGGQSSQH